jgi:3-hydroxybutyryl-CoA dehydratase
METPRACMSIEELTEGMRFEKPYTITSEMVRRFSELSGDWNPAHHDEEYARGTIFGARIAHGLLSVAQFSGIFGMDLPGLGAIWMQQGVTFLAPVYLDRPYTAVATVKAVDREARTARFETVCLDEGGKRVLEGDGLLKPIPAKVKARLAEAGGLPGAARKA